jgi:hypothetical protein
MAARDAVEWFQAAPSGRVWLFVGCETSENFYRPCRVAFLGAGMGGSKGGGMVGRCHPQTYMVLSSQ